MAAKLNSNIRLIGLLILLGGMLLGAAATNGMVRDGLVDKIDTADKELERRIDGTENSYTEIKTLLIGIKEDIQELKSN